MGKQWKQCQTLFWGAPKSLQMVTAAVKLRLLLLGRKVMTKLDSILKSRGITLPTKVRLVRLWIFLWSYMDVRVGLWRKLSTEELMLLNCGVEEDSWESLGLLEIQPIHSKGDQLWVFFGRNDAKAETPVLWPQHEKSWLTGKDSDAGRDWGQEEKGEKEDEMVGWHHQLNGHEFEQASGVGDGQGGLACCNSWGSKESDITELLHWTDLIQGGNKMVIAAVRIKLLWNK